MAQTVNLLEYLRSRSQIDIDSQDIHICEHFGPFADCTSNQADEYCEFLNPQRAALLQDAVESARELHADFSDVAFQELAVEIAMIKVSLSIVPLITDAIHVMANPLYSHSMDRLLKNGQRIATLCHRLDPTFDTSRLCVKVPATWEGFQACRKLAAIGVKTLATTVFTMEQSAIAAEAGCVYIAPFVHELKALFEEEYEGSEPILPLCVQAQHYFIQHNYATRVKAAGLNCVDEAKQLAGVASITLAPPLVHELAGMQENVTSLELRSLFKTVHADCAPGGAAAAERLSYINDEQKYRKAYHTSEGGKGRWKTDQAIGIFSDYQRKAEALLGEIAGKSAEAL